MEPSFNEIQRVELIVNTQPLSPQAQFMSLYIYQGINVSDHATLTFMRERDSSFYLKHGDTVAIGLGGGNGKLPIVYEGVVSDIEVTPLEWKVRLSSAGADKLRQACPITVYNGKSHANALMELITQAGLKAGTVALEASGLCHNQLVCGGVSYGEVMTYLASCDKRGIFVTGNVVNVVGLYPASPSLKLEDNGCMIDYRIRQQQHVVSGEIKLLGTSQAIPGITVDIDAGVEEMNGQHLIGAVAHEVKDGNWTTTIYLDAPPVINAPTISLTGTVGIIADDKKSFNVRVPIDSSVPASYVSINIPVTSASDFTPMPAQNQQVKLTSTLSGPVVLQTSLLDGFEALYHNGNKIIGIEDKQLVLYGNKETKLTVTNKETGLSLRLSNTQVDKGMLTLEDGNGNSINMGKTGVTIVSNQSVKLEHSVGSVTVGTDVLIKANAITQEADVSLKLTGNASTELLSTGDTTIKGAMVHIN